MERAEMLELLAQAFLRLPDANFKILKHNFDTGFPILCGFEAASYKMVLNPEMDHRASEACACPAVLASTKDQELIRSTARRVIKSWADVPLNEAKMLRVARDIYHTYLDDSVEKNEGKAFVDLLCKAQPEDMREALKLATSRRPGQTSMVLE